MTQIDTSAEAVERLVADCEFLATNDAAPNHDTRVAATLRALGAERDTLLARLEAAEAVCEAAGILLAGEGDVMTRMATTIDPAEYASTHEECHARDLEAALDVWKEASK